VVPYAFRLATQPVAILQGQVDDFPDRLGRIANYSDRENLTQSGPAGSFPFLLAIQDLVLLKSNDTLA
jgi:hypothetical protein